MQILNRTLKLTGGETSDVVIGVNLKQGVVTVLENRGPSTVDIVDIGPLDANRFMIIGSMEIIKLRSQGQFTTVDVTAFTC